MINEKIRQLEETYKANNWFHYSEENSIYGKKIILEYEDKSFIDFDLNNNEYLQWREILENSVKEKKVYVDNQTNFKIEEGQIYIGVVGNGQYKDYSCIYIAPEIINKLSELKIILK